jgi:threonine/homoserine/homoserine lactone efflux protein
MSFLIPAGPRLAAFLAASFLLAVAPGPGVFYIVTRSARHGRAAGLASVAGVALGNLGNVIAAALGLAAIFALSASAFLAVKYLGAAYLIYLGVQAIRSRGRREPAGTLAPPKTLRRIFTDGFVVALLNPKTSLFFVAFLPQFLPRGAPPAYTVALGGVFVAIAATTDTCYALAAGVARRWFPRGGYIENLARYISGGALVGLGLVAALTGERARS